MSEIHPKLSFSAGIERVVSKPQGGEPALPDRGDVTIGAGRYEQQLESILFPPSLEQSLVDSLRPEIVHQDLLTPQGFEAELAECSRLVDKLAKASTDEQGQEKLKRLGALLNEEKELRQLLKTYRHLLHRA